MRYKLTNAECRQGGLEGVDRIGSEASSDTERKLQTVETTEERKVAAVERLSGFCMNRTAGTPETS